MIWLCWKTKEREEPAAVVGEGHDNIRTYNDDGVQGVDNIEYDMKHLIKYSIKEHVGGHSANIRHYTDSGVGDVDNLNFDLDKLTSPHNLGFSSSESEVRWVEL